MINTVKVHGSGYLVNSKHIVPNDPANSDFQAVQRWIIGHTDTWLCLEEEFKVKTKEHNNWLAIRAYDADLLAYNEAIMVWSEDSGLGKPEKPEKPDGYSTSEEVALRDTEIENWQIGFDAWKASTDDSKPSNYCIKKPKTLYIPADMVEPLVPVLPTPIPNIVEPELAQDQVDAIIMKEAQDLEDDMDAAVIRNIPDLRNLMTARPVQIDNWVSNNVTDLSSAKDVIAMLAKATSLLLKNNFR